MPRRLPVKPDRFIGNLFIILVFLTLSLVYYSVVGVSLGPRFFDSNLAKIVLALFHFLLIMLLWCLIQTILMDPGQVPTFWGFHFGDHESKRKRYCLMCNVFKPERCHHCSTCNRCVLNMDHHCPWVNNCIGFWNRKPFVLLLIYVLLSAYLSALTLTVDLYFRLPQEYGRFENGTDEYAGFVRLCVVIMGEVITCAASFIMTNFLRFHIELILNNKTTIEFLEKKGEHFESIYNMSPAHNWRQVFGYNKLLWFFPISIFDGHPVGDGVYWPVNPEIKARVLQNTGKNDSVHSQANQAQNNGENEKFIEKNDSDKYESNRTPDNKENIDVMQRANDDSRRHQDSNDSRDSHIKFNPNIGKQFHRNIDTAIVKKDDNNTLIVHSQDNRKMLKNTIIKNNI